MSDNLKFERIPIPILGLVSRHGTGVLANFGLSVAVLFVMKRGRGRERSRFPIGTRFGKLVIIDRVKDVKGKRTRYKCQCDCGDTLIVQDINLRNAGQKSCRRCAARKLLPIGTRFGSLVVVKREDVGPNTAYRCHCDCGSETVARATDLRTGRNKSCGCGESRKLIPIGTRFGKLVVIERAPNQGKNETAYRCKCDCGDKLVVRAFLLRKGRQSCPECSKLPKGEVGFNVLFATYKESARKRRHVCEFTRDEFRKLVTSNCAYCGIPPSAIVKAHPERGNFTYNGIDRMDNELGYVPGNVAPCCRQCNFAKSAKDYDEWIEWLDRIAKFRTRRKK